MEPNPVEMIFGEEMPRPRNFEELAILLVDASGSMRNREKESGLVKSEQVRRHLIDDSDGLLARMQASKNRDAWHLAMISFDDRVEISQPAAVLQVRREALDVDLLMRHGNSTAIGTALEQAYQVAQDWLVGGDPLIPRYVTMLLMSDGGENCSSDPLGAAARIKAHGQPDGVRPPIMIASAAYGDEADAALLAQVASPRADGTAMFARVGCGKELRDFFMQSLTMVSASCERR